MSYLGAGSFLLALFVGAGPSVPATAGTALVSVRAAADAPAASPTPAPVALTASPVLRQQPSGAWTVTVYLNTPALCPNPSFDLVTTNPYQVVHGTPDPALPSCKAGKATRKSKGKTPAPSAVTTVNVNFGTIATVPVAAAVLVIPDQPGAAPLSVTVTVQRQVTWAQYAWIPLACGLGLALLLFFTMLIFRLPDPDRPDPRNGRPQTISYEQFWNKPLYASAGWTFSGSWATNVTTAVAVITTLLAATGTVSELLPGVELGRFSLLIAVAGGIIVAAPLVFGAVNYGFERLDPTTAGVSVITLPEGPDQFGRRPRAGIAVPAGATVTVYGSATVRRRTGQAAQAAADIAELPLATDAVLKSGAKLNVPSGATITVSPSSAAAPILALPGASDITVFADQRIRVSPWATVAEGDIAIAHPAPAEPVPARPEPPDWDLLGALRDLLGPAPAPVKPAAYRLGRNLPIRLPSGAKVSVVGRASLALPAGTIVTAPGIDPGKPARRSSLKTATVFPVPHLSEVVASQMSWMLLASCITLFGTGAELGILGVLAFSLSSAGFAVRLLCVLAVALAAAVVLVYGVVSIRALADPKPGDALTTTGSTSFIL
jgi:hypothetical protein